MTEPLTPARTVARDLTAGLVVFLVALPLCLGVALASNAPLIAGLLAGIIGGIIVGTLSGSHTSVSGTSAGLTAVVAAQIAALGSFEAFLLAVVLAGMIQVILGLSRAGFIAAFFPSSVVKGLLAAIGVILILKQLPHLVGHDPDPEGDMAFFQPDSENTFSELIGIVTDLNAGAAFIGLSSLAILVFWDRSKRLKNSPIPAPLVVVALGVAVSLAFRELGGIWAIGPSHLVQMPVPNSLEEFGDLLRLPDFSQWARPAIYVAAATIAAVASLETLLNLEAVDKLDPRGRTSPPNRELIAQGAGNIVAGLVGALPVTSVIIRSSVNITSGARTKCSAVFHGVLLLLSILLIGRWLNLIPLSCLAAILLVTGLKLASPAVFRRMWRDGRPQFLPFIITVAAIVLTDLLVGVLLGFAVSTCFVLWSNVRRPLRKIVEKHLGGEVVHIELANQVSFLNRAALAKALDDVPAGGHVLLDAQNTDYIDPDILALVRDFKDHTAPARNVQVSLLGFRTRYALQDQTQYVDYSTRELQSALSPAQVLDLLKEGHERFRSGRRLTRDLGRQVHATAAGQHPLAVVLGCIDSRTPSELIFDLGVGDVFAVRIAGNIVTDEVLGSIEYACNVAGAKLIVVKGHTRCGAVTAAVQLRGCTDSIADKTGCQHLGPLIAAIQEVVPAGDADPDDAARRNVQRSVDLILERSDTIRALVREGRVAVVGAMYDVSSGKLEFMAS
jgi:carbonic anhydrase/SulP family sulfate permease